MIRWPLLVGILFAAWGGPSLAASAALPLHASGSESRVLPREAPPRGWPVVGRQSIPRRGEHWDEWDGMPRRHLMLTVPGLALLLPWAVMDYWVELPADEREGHGFAARYRWNERLRLGIMLARREVFLPTLDETDWSAYLADLARVPGRLLLANDDSAANPQMLTLLGSRTRFLAYWDPVQGDRPEQLTWQTVWQHRGYTLVLTMTAPYQTLVDVPALFEGVGMAINAHGTDAAGG